MPTIRALILESQYEEVLRRMDKMRVDHGDPESWDVHHWQDINPVHTEALLQLTCGGPQIIYHGGLLHVRLRYFDAQSQRPGLPENVSALVSALDADSTTVELVTPARCTNEVSFYKQVLLVNTLLRLLPQSTAVRMVKARPARHKM